jgi:hypothetical protein
MKLYDREICQFSKLLFTPQSLERKMGEDAERADPLLGMHQKDLISPLTFLGRAEALFGCSCIDDDRLFSRAGNGSKTNPFGAALPWHRKCENKSVRGLARATFRELYGKAKTQRGIVKLAK